MAHLPFEHWISGIGAGKTSAALGCMVHLHLIMVPQLLATEMPFTVYLPDVNSQSSNLHILSWESSDPYDPCFERVLQPFRVQACTDLNLGVLLLQEVAVAIDGWRDVNEQGSLKDGAGLVVDGLLAWLGGVGHCSVERSDVEHCNVTGAACGLDVHGLGRRPAVHCMHTHARPPCQHMPMYLSDAPLTTGTRNHGIAGHKLAVELDPRSAYHDRALHASLDLCSVGICCLETQTCVCDNLAGVWVNWGRSFAGRQHCRQGR